MVEHITEKQIESYHKNLLMAEELLRFDDHLAVCENCRLRVQEDAKLESIFAAVYSDLQKGIGSDHIPYEQIADYVDDKLDAVHHENLESHFEVCVECEAEVQDLRTFKKTLQAEEATGFGVRFVSFWRTPIYWTPLRLAAVIAVIALSAWFVTLYFRNEVKQLRASLQQVQNQTVQLQQQNKQLQQDLRIQIAHQQESTSTPIILSDGQFRWKLDRGNLTGVENLPDSYNKMLSKALLAKEIEKSSLPAQLAGKKGILLSSQHPGVPFSLITPVGTVERMNPPTFRWKPLEGATDYRLTVYDSNFNEVAASPLQAKTEWTPSDSLSRAKIYTWQVTAIKDNKEVLSPVPPAPEARFKILEQSKVEELEKVEKDYPASHLLHGLLYAREGLVEDAEREFQALYQENPQSEIAQKFLQSAQKK